MQPKLFLAIKVFINYQGKILLLRESKNYAEGVHEGKYDVPGGRVEPGEKWSDALAREVKEETGLSVGIGKPFFVNEWRPIVQEEPWQVVGIFFECVVASDKIVLSDDHDEYVWINPEDYKKYTIIENLIPVFEEYLEFKK